jgi:hypothetical protein
VNNVNRARGFACTGSVMIRPGQTPFTRFGAHPGQQKNI